MKNRRRSATRHNVTRPQNSLPEEPLPKFVEPQLATLVSVVPEGTKWLHELKLDGYRILCRLDVNQVTLLTRTAQDWTHRMPAVAEAVKKLPARQAFVDGEVVALDDSGMPSFQLLQNSFRYGDASRLVYYAFDLLYVDGRDLRGAALVERKQTLQRLLTARTTNHGNGAVRFSEHWLGRGKKLYKKACEMGLEGIVAKRIDEPYRSGRGQSWLKIKCLKSQEFVIGGFTEPAGARSGFGALLIGVHDNGGALRYVGRVGTGFNDRLLRDLRARLEKLERASSPFMNPPKGAEARGVHWVDPVLVGEVDFIAWTSDRLLRHPSFKGLREDKPAVEIAQEKSAPLPRKYKAGWSSG
jgi:bifunctional non-homologous end joining protein LigD